jgi:hypothetical protein
MVKINFYPESDLKEYKKTVEKYQSFWDKDGEQITKVLEKQYDFTFRESYINALIFDSVSYFHPTLSLRANYPENIKRGTLIHELGHRLLQGNGINQLSKFPQWSGNHKILFLKLYDTWILLYGKDFAKQNVIAEKQRHEEYKKAWKWALSFTKKERSDKYKKLIKTFKSK